VIVWITDWALQSYLDMKHRRVFTDLEYRQEFRPDAERLKNGWPSSDPKFHNSRFWGPATDKNGSVIADGYKMKWHHIGNGQIQLRLCIVILGSEAFLCQAYVKDAKSELRNMALLKARMPLLRAGTVTLRGQL
jgi:hypothetical protein